MPKVVVIGGSYAAQKAAGICYKHIAGAEITMVAPNTHCYFNCAAPRLLVEPEGFDKTVFSNAQVLSEATAGSGTLVQGLATGVDFAAKTVAVTTAGGAAETLHYDVLVVATGQSYKFPAFGVGHSHEDALASILATHRELKTAKSVALIGGGATAVECAGEIARELKPAAATLYTGQPAPMHAVSPVLAAAATKRLEALGVAIVNGERASVAGKTVAVPGGGAREYDVVIECYATAPNTAFLPESVKNAAGFVVTDATLAVVGQPGVYAMGDIVAGGCRTLVDINLRQAGVLASALKNRSARAPEGPYKPLSSTILVPISRDGGVGIAFGWSVPSFVVRFAKSRDYMVGFARKSFSY